LIVAVDHDDRADGSVLKAPTTSSSNAATVALIEVLHFERLRKNFAPGNATFRLAALCHHPSSLQSNT